MSYLGEYADAYLLFVYRAKGGLWGQFDTTEKYLPRHKDRASLASPAPGPAFAEWKTVYLKLKEAEALSKPLTCTVFGKSSELLPNSSGNTSETFPRAVAVAVAVDKNICPSHDERDGELSIDHTPFEPTEPSALFPVEPKQPVMPIRTKTEQQKVWFEQFWSEYWRRGEKRKDAEKAFARHVRTAARFDQVMAAMRAQKTAMLAREKGFRPLGASWLNGERWEDELSDVQESTEQPARRVMM
jgi:hypothetical protein